MPVTSFESVATAAADRDEPALLAASALAVGDTVAEVAADRPLLALLDRASECRGLDPGTRVRLAARRAIATYWLPDGAAESRRWRRRGPTAAGWSADYMVSGMRPGAAAATIEPMAERTNIQTVQRIYEAFGSADADAIVEVVTDDVDWATEAAGSRGAVVRRASRPRRGAPRRCRLRRTTTT
jgi:hypothetical protein